MSRAAVEESDKEGCNSGGEEIIELQDIRLRHRDGVDVPHQGRDRQRADVRAGRGRGRSGRHCRVFVFTSFVVKEVGVIRIRGLDLLVNF